MSDYIHEGVRLRLDTRNIERVGSNPSEAAIKKTEQRRREKHVSKVWNAIRLGLCTFCGWFAFNHIDVLLKNGMVVLELAGVIFALGFIATTIADIYERGIEND